MKRRDAIKIDREHGFYSDYDADSGCFGVFGLETGFCYRTTATRDTAAGCAQEYNLMYECDTLSKATKELAERYREGGLVIRDLRRASEKYGVDYDDLRAALDAKLA